MNDIHGNQEKVLIFQIIHGSFVDGPGCRTTIFLKGCPLTCLWCCNPEGQRVEAEVKNNKNNVCTGCGDCVTACPVGAISMEEILDGEVKDYRINVDRRKCTHCGKCAVACGTGRLEMFGAPYSVDEIFEIIRRDERQYSSTGGGVTIGGGECTMFGKYTLELVRKCKEHYINTALDTCGYINNPEGLQAFDEADYVLFDIKGFDPARHKANTGVDNALILKNLRRRNDLGKPIVIRYPMIPGYNDSDEEIDNMAKLLSEFKMIEHVDIIPFHDYCRVKYEQLGIEYPIETSATMLTEEDEKTILERFERYGLKAQIGG